MNCYINLIPYNETENIGYKRSKEETIREFYDILKKNHTSVTKRKSSVAKLVLPAGNLEVKRRWKNEIVLFDGFR